MHVQAPVQVPLQLLVQHFDQLGVCPQLDLQHFGGYAVSAVPAEPAVHAEHLQQMSGPPVAAEVCVLFFSAARQGWCDGLHLTRKWSRLLHSFCCTASEALLAFSRSL